MQEWLLSKNKLELKDAKMVT